MNQPQEHTCLLEFKKFFNLKDSPLYMSPPEKQIKTTDYHCIPTRMPKSEP